MKDRPSVRENRVLMCASGGEYSDSGVKVHGRPTTHTVARQSRIPTGFPRTLDAGQPSDAFGGRQSTWPNLG